MYKKKKENILMIDDVASNLHLLSQIFKDDYNVFIATDGQMGLEIALGDMKPDIILLDIMMPSMNGYEVLKKLKENSVTSSIPIIFLTALETQESQEYGFSLGAVDYITKPYNPKLVKRRVETHLRLNTLYNEVVTENAMLSSKIAMLESIDSKNQVNLFHKLFDTTRDGVVLTDADEKIISINEAYTEITGYAIGEVKEQTSRMLKSDRQNKTFYEKMWESLETKGIWSGEVYNRRKNGEIYQEILSISAIYNQSGIVIYYLGVFSDITYLKRAKETIDRLKLHDHLTGLPNRLLFTEYLNHILGSAKATGKFGAALSFDINNFRQINILGGINLGDQILKKVAVAITSLVDKGTIVSHMNSDLFAIVFANLFVSKEEAGHFIFNQALKIEQTFQQISMELEDDSYKLRPSIGMSIIDGEQKNLVVPDVIRELESARFEAKKSQTENIVLYDKELEVALKKKIVQEQELYAAVKQKNFELFVQEQFDREKRLKGLEILIRWPHETKGYISPTEFIPLAEANGLILKIDMWVLTSSFALLQKMKNEYKIDVRISVNVSAQEFKNKEFVESIKGLCDLYEYEAGHMLIEITEYMMINDIDEVINTAHDLKLLGIGISIDDFGTGYSNLHYMQYLPITELKIDKSFIDTLLEDENSQNIVEIINELSKRFKYELIVEGVETQEQAEWIFNMNPQAIIQGYLYSKPISVKSWLENL